MLQYSTSTPTNSVSAILILNSQMYPLGIQPARPEIPSHKSVGGWLLFLCFSLTVLSPITVINTLMSEILPAIDASHSIHATVLYRVHAVVISSIGILAFLAGFRLWMVKAGAVKFAQRCLGAIFCLHLGYFAFWLVFYQQRFHTGFGYMGWIHIGQPLIFFAIWFLYLDRSTRVRETYPPADIPIPAQQQFY